MPSGPGRHIEHEFSLLSTRRRDRDSSLRRHQPGTASVCAVPSGRRDDLDPAVRGARRAFPSWRKGRTPTGSMHMASARPLDSIRTSSHG